MRVKGNIIKARITFVTENFGQERWQQVLNALDEEDRELFGGMITNVGWYPFDKAAHLDETIVSVLGGGDTKIFEEIGRASARSNLTGVHKELLTPGDPQAFMKQARMIYGFYYDIGHRTYEPTGPNSGILTTYDAETFSTADCATVIGWYKEALAMCGAREVVMVEETCRAKGGDACRYRVSWR